MAVLRILDDAMDHPKLMKLPAEVFRFWFQCVCLANRMTPRGTLPDADTIAYRVRSTEGDVVRWLAVLEERRLLDRGDDGTYSVHDWEHYQGPTSTARVKTWRDKKRGATVAKQDETVAPRFATNDETGCNKTQQTVKQTVTNSETSETLTRARGIELIPECESVSVKPTTTPPDDDDEVICIDPLGDNTSKQVSQALYAVEQLYPLSSERASAQVMLNHHRSDRVIAAFAKAHKARANCPAEYAAKLLASPTFGVPTGRASPSHRPPAKQLTEEEMADIVSKL